MSSRIPRELLFSDGGTTYRAILMDEHVACRVIYEACMLCGNQLGNLAFYTTFPFIFRAHTACLLQSRATRPPTNHEGSRDIGSNLHPPPNTFYYPYQPTLPPHGNNYASNYHPVPNYYPYQPTPPNVPYYAQPPYPPPNVPYYAQPPYPPPNLHNHGHGMGALMGMVGMGSVKAFLEVLFQNMLS